MEPAHPHELGLGGDPIRRLYPRAPCSSTTPFTPTSLAYLNHMAVPLTGYTSISCNRSSTPSALVSWLRRDLAYEPPAGRSPSQLSALAFRYDEG